MKKYKLLKDINHPSYDTIKAGTIFSKPSHACKDTAYANKGVNMGFHPDRVENNPEWFEEVKEKPFEQEFIAAAADFFLKYGAVQFTHDDLRHAFEAGRMRSGSFWIEENIFSFNRNFYAFETFEEYLGSRGQNKH